jgi:hypothetical protein
VPVAEADPLFIVFMAASLQKDDAAACRLEAVGEAQSFFPISPKLE